MVNQRKSRISQGVKMRPDEKEMIVESVKIIHAKNTAMWKLSAQISDSTRLNYQNAMVQLNKQREQAKINGVTFVLDYPNKNTRAVFASAIRRDAMQRLLHLPHMDSIKSAKKLLTEVQVDLKQVEEMIARHKNIPKSKKSSVSDWTIGLAALEKIRPRWRDELQLKMAKSKYAALFAIQRASGCRTEELVRGVTVAKASEGEYLITIDTAKQRVANMDNRVRVIKSFDKRLEPFVGLVKLNVQTKETDAPELRANAIKLAKNNYKQTLMNTSKRLFGLAISPKAFRASMSSDLRAVGATTAGVAEVLGHGTTDCANKYSRGLNVRGRGRSIPVVLETARVKVQSKPISTSLANSKKRPLMPTR
jgi:site-specific recombinase XerD